MITACKKLLKLAITKQLLGCLILFAYILILNSSAHAGAWIGIKVAQKQNDSLSDFLGTPLWGLGTITYVFPNSPAEKSGIKAGDLLYGITNLKIKNYDEFRKFISTLHKGDSVDLRIGSINKNNKNKVETRTITVTLTEAPPQIATLPYQSIEMVPPGSPSPIDGVWLINQSRMRISAGRMFFLNDIPGVAQANMVNIKDIRQIGPRSYTIKGFRLHTDGKTYYLPGTFQLVSDNILLLTMEPNAALGLPNGFSEIYTLEKPDNEALFAAQLSPFQSAAQSISETPLQPTFTAVPDDNAVAIVIGIEKYLTLPSAGFVRSDAALMRDYLKAMGYQDRNIEFLTDDRATFSSIRKAVETWLPNRINNKSRVTIYYAGHGAPDPQTGEAYIVPYDGDPNYLPDTGYSLKRLYTKLENLKARQVVVLVDACFSGAGGRGVLAAGARSLVRIEKAAPKGDRIAILTSTQGSQISTSSPEKKHGIFTYYLLQAIQKGNRDLTTVYAYLKPLVEDEAKRLNVEQTPSISPELSQIKGIFKLW